MIVCEELEYVDTVYRTVLSVHVGEYLAHGTPIGRVHAIRPGHAANARALRRALDEGIVAPV